ncbi:Na/Pi cotransporter family protein, partial [bacterium]|nr:Na/Pi cotransporter family protein [bacterium]
AARTRRAPVRALPIALLTLLALALVAPDPAGALDALSLVAPSEVSDLHVGVVGDTVQVTFQVVNEAGEGVPGAPVRLGIVRSVAAATPPPDEVLPANSLGRVTFRIPLKGPPGDFLLRARLAEPGSPVVRVPARVLRKGWGWFVLIGTSGALALFLYGLRLIGRGLERAAGGSIRSYLAWLTANPFRSLLFGMAGTLMVQSSSASTVLLVSFANAGLVTLEQCLGATLGAAIGSTFTVQLVSFRISEYSLLAVAIGFAMTLASGRARRVGGIVFGAGLMFYGLSLMSDAMSPLKGMPVVAEFFAAAARDPVPAILLATVFTAIVQASAATIGVVLGLSFQGILTLDAAIPFVLGANIGTAATAVLASLTSETEGRRVAWAHAAFRAGGVLIVMPFLGPFAQLVRASSTDLPRQIANAHTLLNLGTAILFFPTLPFAARLFRRLIPEKVAPREFGPRSLDPRFHEQPTIALAGALQEVLQMGQFVREMLDDVKQALRTDDEELAASIRERDDRVDLLDEEITKYLTRLSTEYLSDAQSQRVLDLLFVTKDLELMADIISKGLVPGLLRKKRQAGLRFSDVGFHELLEFHDRVRGMVDLAIAAVATWDAKIAEDVLERKRRLSMLERRMHVAHLERLRAGNEESRRTTTVHVDAVNDLKRIVSHAARIAYAVLGKVHSLPRDEEVVMGDREE